MVKGLLIFKALRSFSRQKNDIVAGALFLAFLTDFGLSKINHEE
jgi:hypothetical protein